MRFFSRKPNDGKVPPQGLAAWLLTRVRCQAGPQPRLALVERISLAPRQTVALVEAEGQRFLIATSADGSPAFHALSGFSAARGITKIPARSGNRTSPRRRVSW